MCLAIGLGPEEVEFRVFAHSGEPLVYKPDEPQNPPIRDLFNRTLASVTTSKWNFSRWVRRVRLDAYCARHAEIDIGFVCFIAAQLHATAVIKYTHRHTQTHIHRARSFLQFDRCLTRW